MEIIKLNNFEYMAKKNEFILTPHNEYNNLKIYPKVGELERIVGLLNDLIETTSDAVLKVIGWSYGGFIPIGCSKVYKRVVIITENIVQTENMPNNIEFNTECTNPNVIYINNNNILKDNNSKSYILCNKKINLQLKEFTKVLLHDSELVLYIPLTRVEQFYRSFSNYFDEDQHFKYDNLINLCLMVKNAGPLFEKVLTDNLPIIDRWTILDTGSTDGTQDIIRKVLKNKEGNLYEEPFINFRESRNRCLDLAGNVCKYNLMLDDTYVIKNDLRQFLNIVRGDQFATSYSLLVKSDDYEYVSNRITRSEKNHRYIYTIHEVIQFEGNKENVLIPKSASYIDDYRADYMEKRTMNRKTYDLKLLHDMIEEDPTNPRHYYYLAQTYNLLEDYEKAAEWFYKRATTELKGHNQEVFDSWFELARVYNFKLNKPWEECKKLYEESIKAAPTRPEGLYFLGIHYYLEGDKEIAYDYFKQAFTLGYPIHAQFSLKPTLSFHFLPKFLCELCYTFNNPSLGLAAAERFLENNKEDADSYDVIVSWYNIFKQLIKSRISNNINVHKKPIIVFVVDGNWNPWTGSDILTKGMGGSETYIIEIARWIQATNKYNCVVFCNCSKEEAFENVEYKDINEYSRFISENKIHTCIVSRFSEYIPLSLHNNVDNVYLVLHDLSPSGIIIPLHQKLNKVLCLTDWHVDHFLKTFPQFKNRAESFYYGIDTTLFKPTNKIKNSFIYSSFPNRGLLPLLQMWPEIKKAIPDAILDVYSDINGKWVNDVAKDQMDKIKELINAGLKDVSIHGWVSKKELAEAWGRADIWFYPCIFQETFCLTALEAAASKTLAIGTPLAALQETISDRGILIEGNPFDTEWQAKAINEIILVVKDNDRKEDLIEKNYRWANERTWKKRGQEFINKYIDTENINNWADDLPLNSGHRKLFEEALEIANPKHILEIGEVVGTSLIEMLKLFPDAKGVAINSWVNEENNVNPGLAERVKSIKGDSVDKLCELIEASRQFDFIYVDGSYKCLDCYTNMILSWQLLRKGGVLAVNNVLCENRDDPLMTKKHFMEKYTGQYKVISDSYRLFISKN